MTLGDITLVEAAAGQGPIFYDRVTIVGDGAYPADGTPSFEALLQAVIGNGRQIIGLQSEPDGEINQCEYDHAADKLFVRVRATGVESAVSDQSALTYSVLVTSK